MVFLRLAQLVVLAKAARLASNDQGLALEAVQRVAAQAGHRLGGWSPSRRLGGFQEAACSGCGRTVAVGPTGQVVGRANEPCPATLERGGTGGTAPAGNCAHRAGAAAILQRSEQAKAKPTRGLLELTVGKDYPDKVLHGTTGISAKGFVSGQPVSRRQETMSEFGDNVLYVSERDAPHQALMFGEHGGKGYGGRCLLELRLRPGARVADLTNEMTRRPAWGRSPRESVLAFNGRPSFTDDMGAWLQERRRIRGAAERDVSAYYDPEHPEFNGGRDYAPLMANYLRDRGYHAFRLADETVILDPSVVVGGRKLSAKEVAAVKATPRKHPPSQHGSLYSQMPWEDAKKVELSKARRYSEDRPLRAKTPNVSFEEPDNVHSGTAESVLRNYGDPKKHYDVYPGYVPSDEAPRPRLAEVEERDEHRRQYHSWGSKERCPDEEDGRCPYDDGDGYDWESFRGRSRPFPAPTLHVPLRGEPSWSDGNHRVEHWSNGNYTHYPAWILQERRRPRTKKAELLAAFDALAKAEPPHYDAMVDPDGKFHDVCGSHPDWCHDNRHLVGFVGTRNSDNEPATGDEATYDEDERHSLDHFLDAGWMRYKARSGLTLGYLHPGNVARVRRLATAIARQTGRAPYVETCGDRVDPVLHPTGRLDFSKMNAEAERHR